MLEKNKIRIKYFIWIKEIVIGTVVFLIILTPLIKGLELNEFHPDETFWIKSSKYFKLFWIDKDFFSNQWEEWGCVDQPPVGKYIIGLSLFLSGKEKAFQEVNKIRDWDWNKGEEKNRMQGAVPPREILFTARLTMAIFGALTCLLIYFIGRIVFGMAAGIFASLLLAYNPLMLLFSKRALTDMPLLFFMTANILLMIGFYYSFLKQRKILTFFMASLIGINAALAIGTKYNGGLSIIIFTFFCIILGALRIKELKSHQVNRKSLSNQITIDKQTRLIFISLLISILIAAIIFLGINPYFYRETLRRLINQIFFHINYFHQLQITLPKSAIFSLSQKITFVILRTLTPGNGVILGNILKVPVDLVIFFIGLSLLFYSEVKYFFERGKLSYKSIILIWVLVSFIGTICWIPLNWGRYYLPVILCVTVITGYSLAIIIKRSWSVLKRINSLLLKVSKN